MTENKDCIDIDIVTGFLGAGKTTLINKFLAEGLGTDDTALIENEFGDVPIDDDIVEGGPIQVTTMSTGCICCTLKGDFITNITNIVETYHPSRIIIEPTGLANLADLIGIVRQVNETIPLHLNSVITVVGAENLLPLLAIGGDFFKEQLEQARFIVFSCVQMTDKDSLQDALDAVMELKQEMTPVIVQDWAKLDAFEIMALAEEAQAVFGDGVGERVEPAHPVGREREHDHHDHEHTRAHGNTGCTSSAFFPTREFSEGDLETLMAKLDDGSLGVVMRAKGFLPRSDGTRVLLEHVYGRATVRESSYAGPAKFVVIGRDLDEAALGKLLA